MFETNEVYGGKVSVYSFCHVFCTQTRWTREEHFVFQKWILDRMAEVQQMRAAESRFEPEREE